MAMTQAGAQLHVHVGLFARIERHHELAVATGCFHANGELSRSCEDPADWFGDREPVLIPNLPEFTANADPRREANEQRASPRDVAIRHGIADRHVPRRGVGLKSVNPRSPLGHAIEARLHVHMDNDAWVASWMAQTRRSEARFARRLVVPQRGRPAGRLNA